jgi:hypothetical protein
MIFHQDTNISKYGVYRVGSDCYYNKLDAVTAHIRTGLQVTWHLFEEELSNIDLTAHQIIISSYTIIRRSRS